MASQSLISTINGYENYIEKNGIDESVMDAYIEASEVAIKTEKDIQYGLQLTKRCKEIIERFCVEHSGVGIWDLEKYAQDNDEEYTLIDKWYKTLKTESYYDFESFMFYMERKRHYSKRFYFPRRHTLKIVVNDLQDLENRIIKFYGLSMPSRVGKSTICIFFLAWVSLRRPNSHSAMGGHSGILAKGFYKELMNLFTTEEYTFSELFYFWNPEYANKPLVTDKSADEFTITLGNPDRFATVTCRGIDGTWTGAVDVSKDGYLYVDDLVRDREHSLSPMRMENTYQEYLNKMVDRKNDGARELMVGTLWNVLDPLERMRKQYENDSQYRFRRIPALDENDESNFDYEINGFSTAYYRDMREKLDKAEWMAKFMQKPYVREGLLFPDNELRFFNGDFNEELENKERKIIALCDPAFGGADNLSMPVCADFGGKQKYIIDWVYKKGTQAVTVPLIVAAIKKHYITELHIEQNAGGKLITDSIKAEMKKQNVYFCRIIPYYANTKLPKEEKIKGYSDRVKEIFVFLISRQYLAIDDRPTYIRTQMYQDAMDEFTMYTSEGKNPHDDASDSITQLAIVIDKKATQTVIMSSPI
jgi:hypothetical protein|nr:MAG TPA: Terminase [Caudoviricetes sp.]